MSKCELIMICCGHPLKLNERNHTSHFKHTLFRQLFRPKTSADDIDNNKWQHEVANHYRDIKQMNRSRTGKSKKRRSENIIGNHLRRLPGKRSAPVRRDQLAIPHMVFPRYIINTIS